MEWLGRPVVQVVQQRQRPERYCEHVQLQTSLRNTIEVYPYCWASYCYAQRSAVLLFASQTVWITFRFTAVRTGRARSALGLAR